MNDAFTTSAIMSIVLCFYMMTYYDVIINYQEADYSSSRVIGLVRFALSLVQLSMSMVYGYFWIRFKIWEVPEKQTGEPEPAPLPIEAPKDTGPNTLVEKLIRYIKRLIVELLLGYLK